MLNELRVDTKPEPAATNPPGEQRHASVRLSCTAGFGAWLDDRPGVLAVSTITSDLLMLFTGDGRGGISLRARNTGFTRGISADRTRIWVAGDMHLFHLVNIGSRAVDGTDYDAVYAMHSAWHTGDCLLHDVAHDVTLGAERHDVVFVNTNHSVIATLDRNHSFRPLWKPKHISRLAPEDRCHLNCLGVRDGAVTYASMFSLTDTRAGWRNAEAGSGVIVDIASQEVICTGMDKPHSLRWHNGRLWALESGANGFGYVDEQTGRFVSVTHIEGFLRGLVMIGDHAVIGTSQLRNIHFKQPFSIPGFIASTTSVNNSGLHVVDLRSGEVVHHLELTGIHGIYDLAFVPNLGNPLIPVLDGSIRNPEWTHFPADWPADSTSGGAVAQ